MPCTATYCPVIARIKLAQADVAGLGGNGAFAPSERLEKVGMAASVLDVKNTLNTVGLMEVTVEMVDTFGFKR